MSPRFRLAAPLLAATCLVAALPGSAQQWLGTSGSAWGNSTNWSPSGIPISGPATSLQFAGSANYTPNADGGPWTVNSILINAPTPYQFTGNAITFDGAGPALIVSGATHQFQNPIVVPGSLAVNVASSSELRLNGAITGSGNIIKSGAGSLHTSGTLGHLGLTLVTAGLLDIDMAGTIPSTIINDAQVNLSSTGSLTVASAVTGTGTVAIEGGQVLATLNHAGATTVQAGAQLDGAVSGTSELILEGTFNTGGSAAGILRSTTTNGQLNINAGTFAISGSATAAYLGAIGGAGALIMGGSGIQVLSGTALNTGPITVLNGTLQIGNGAVGPPSAAGGIVTQAPGLLHLRVPGGFAAGTITGTGNIRVQGPTTCDCQNQGTTQISLEGTLSGSLANTTSLAMDGILNTGAATVGELAGSTFATLNLNSGFFTTGHIGTSTVYGGLLNVAPGTTFTKTGPGSLVLTGPINGTSVANLVNAGGSTLRLGNLGPEPSNVGPTLVNNGTLELRPGATLNLQQPIVGVGTIRVMSGTVAATGAAFNLSGTNAITVDAGAVLNGSINQSPLLTVNGTLNTGGANVRGLSGTGQVNVGGGLLRIGTGSTADSTFNGVIAGSSLQAVEVTGTHTVTLAGANTFNGQAAVLAGGRLLVTGSWAGSAVVAGTLGGTGTIVGQVGTVTSSTLAPGGAPGSAGTLATGNLLIQGDLSIDVGGLAAGTQHDQVLVTGTVFLNSATLTLGGAYTLAAGDSIVIIDNDGTADPVTGTFNGLPEGATFTFNGGVVRITYVGGDGNDIALSPATFTATPTFVGPGGSISPVGAQSVIAGNSAVYTVTPPVNFAPAAPTGTCGGSITGTGPYTYTSAPLAADCDVQFTFVQVAFTATPSVVGAGGSINPAGSQTLAGGLQASFNVIITPGYLASVGGTCGGAIAAGTYTSAPLTADCNVIITFTQGIFTVTTTITGPGTILPAGNQVINGGDLAVFQTFPDPGHTASVTTTCGGSLNTANGIYTSAPILADCTVDVTFAINNYAVTPSADAAGSITPNTVQNIAHNGTMLFNATPVTGYTVTWATSTCPGTPAGNTFNAGPIIAACTVHATYTQNTYSVTPSVVGSGTISPNAAQTVTHGASQAFTAAPTAGYVTSWTASTCPGTVSPDTLTFTAGPVTAACTVVATFTSGAVTTYSAPSATGSGTITATFTGGGATCSYATPQFIPLTGHAASPPAGTAPANTAFPHGLFDFRTTLCTPGSTIAMTITYPAALPADTQYWKYGPTPGNATPHWYTLPATVAGNTVTFTITDGGLGDDDLAANGTIVDQGGPGIPGTPGTATAVPTLSEWMLMLLATLMLFTVILRERKRPKDLI